MAGFTSTFSSGDVMHKFISRLGLALAVMLLTAALPYAPSAQAADNALESIKKSWRFGRGCSARLSPIWLA
jgi:hypothetical protein